MKKIVSIFKIILLMSIVSKQTLAQPIELPKTWKFMAGDDMQYKQVNFDDSKWENLNVNDVWLRPAILAENSFGWYRVSFDLPKDKLGKDLVIMLGTIDDADETYLNGKKIDGKGKFPPNYQTAWDVQRNYIMPRTLLKEHNELAVRIYNNDAVGGIYAGSGTYSQNISYLESTEFNLMVKNFMKDKKSYHQLTTSNGLIAAVYNFKDDKIENVFPHIFAYYDSNQLVKPFVQNIKLNTNEKPISAKYVNNTHVIEVQYKNFSVNYFAPFTTEEKIFYAVISGEPSAIATLTFNYDKTSTKIINKKIDAIGRVMHKMTFLFSFNDDLHNNNDAVKLASKNILKKDLLKDEINFMQNIFAKCKLPSQLTKDEKNLAEQSISILKMAQVSDNEIFPLSHGQILASLRPGVWSISWVRDASFAIEAMTKIGMTEEAKKGLEFMLKASPTNQYEHYIHTDGKDYGVGVPYQISVTRYFGNGREESDFDERGPNIEFDDFGLFLTTFSTYVNQTNDEVFYKKWNDIIVNKVCHAIIHNIGTDNILRQDSGPWEHHLPGKQFLFSSGVCANGLKEIALLQKKYNLPVQIIEDGYQRLLKGINANMLVDGKYFKGNAQNQNKNDHHYYDGGVFEIFANGLINDKKIFLTHMQEYDKILRASDDPTKGYIRFKSQDSYENQEWPFAGLRVAIAQNKFGNRKEAKQLINRVTDFASKNFNAIPEIFSLEYGVYKGSVPMVGYGAGAYLLAVLDYYK